MELAFDPSCFIFFGPLNLSILNNEVIVMRSFILQTVKVEKHTKSFCKFNFEKI